MLNTISRVMHEDDEPQDSPGKPWGDAIGASFLVQVVTFVGIFVFWGASCVDRLLKRNDTLLWTFLQQTLIPSFAGGALLATCVFLLVPESIHLLAGGHGEHEEAAVNATRVRLLEEESHEEHSETEVAWKFGTSLMGGFLITVLLGAIFPSPTSIECDECDKERHNQESILSTAALKTGVLEDEIPKTKTELHRASSVHGTYDLNCDVGDCDHCHECHADDDELKEEQVSHPDPQAIRGHGYNMPLASSILLGDAFHNFTDGIFIGNAFLLCNRSLAYAITASTVYHELAQEIADFALLTQHCGLSMFWALTANFISGFSVVLGAIVILSVPVSPEATGAILGISAGVYLYIATVECIPRILANKKTFKDTLYFVLFFAVGATPIGLVLLNHGHCEGEVNSAMEEDHAHRILANTIY